MCLTRFSHYLRWPRRTSGRAVVLFNDWLGSVAGFAQAILITLAWTLIVGLGLDKHGFWFLYFATAVSFITQFNLAIIGRRSSRKVDEALERIDSVIDDVYATSQATLQLARNEETVTDALITQSEAIAAALKAIQRPRDA